MKILFINNSDQHGGAAKAAYRLYHDLRQHGIEIKMLVRDKTLIDSNIISSSDYESHGLIRFIEKIIWKTKNRIRKSRWRKYPEKEAVFLNDLTSISLHNALHEIDFDILHLHFVANRFLDLNELRNIRKPIVWTLHDAWPFTGICHYFYNCKQYEHSCGSCPFLHSLDPYDLSHKVWEQKKRIFEQINMHVVTPSKWLGKCVSSSSLLGKSAIQVIPNGIDTVLFSPQGEEDSCHDFGLSPDKQKILFGAFHALSDANKGYKFFLSAMILLKNYIDCNNLEIVIVGADKPLDEINLPLPVHYLGYISEDAEMAKIYNIASVLVVPSLSENLSNTIMESMSCGIPTTAFNIGGNSDMIDHKVNGYLAEPFSEVDLAQGIAWCLNYNKENFLSINARKKIHENFPLACSTQQYLDLYSKLYRTAKK